MAMQRNPVPFNLSRTTMSARRNRLYLPNLPRPPSVTGGDKAHRLGGDLDPLTIQPVNWLMEVRLEPLVRQPARSTCVIHAIDRFRQLRGTYLLKQIYLEAVGGQLMYDDCSNEAT